MDTLVTLARGQRVGVFAGSGVGKSTLLGMMARGTEADINVIGLIGERGREVREFLEDDLGPEGLARSVVVVSTSDEPALVRLRAAFVATRLAEYYADSGGRRVADVGLAHAGRHGTARRCLGGGGAADLAWVPAVGDVDAAARVAGAHRSTGARHRFGLVHRAG